MAWTLAYVSANTSATDLPTSLKRQTSSPNTSPSPENKLNYQIYDRGWRGRIALFLQPSSLGLKFVSWYHVVVRGGKDGSNGNVNHSL